MERLASAAGMTGGADFALLAAAAVAAGLARGFSGFGPALIFVPLAAMVIGPAQAAPMMFAIDVAAIAVLTPAAWRTGDRKEAGLLALGAVFGVPAGVAMLANFDAVTLRWMISLAIVALLLLVMSGWRMRAGPRPQVTAGVGLTGGILSGIAMIGGPPVMVYLLGRGADARQIRAAFTLYIAANSTLAGIAFAVAGLLGAWLLAPLAIAAPGYLLGVWIGTRMFGLASELAFRRVCYAMVAFAAVVSLPALDGVLR